MKKLLAKAPRALLASLACVALSACVATPAHLTAHTTDTRYLAGGTVVVVFENSGGKRAEIISPCCHELERSDQNGWRLVECDEGVMCEESILYVEPHGATEYPFYLATSLATGSYRLEARNGHGRAITTTNAFHVQERVRTVSEGELAPAESRPASSTP